MAALTYDQVLDRWDNARAFGETRSLPEYAQHLNDIYGTQDFSAGMQDGPWTRFSHRADQFLGNTVGQLTSPIGEAVGSLFGEGEAGARVGRDLPRALLETAPLYLAGPEAGIPATAAALGLTGGLMAAHTYADTASPKAALISGLTGAALPGVGHFGGALAARLAGASKVSGEWLPEFLREGMKPTFNALLPETAADVSRVETSRFVGSQLAQFAGNEASMYAMHKTLDPNSPFNPLSADFLLQQIPFTVHDAVQKVTAPHPTAEQIRPGLTVPGTQVPEAKPYVPPAKTEQAATLSEAMTNFENVQNDPNATPEQREAAMQALLKTNLNPEAVEKVKNAVTETPPADDTAAILAHPSNVDKLSNGNYRVRVDQYSGDQTIPEHRTVFVNGEPQQGLDENGNVVFKVSDSKIRPADYGLQDRRPVVDPNQPELPIVPSWQQGKGFGGELQNYESPALQGPEIKEPEVRGLTQMGVPPEKTLQLVDTQQKSGNLALDSFQGPIQKDAQGNVVRLGNTSVAMDGWMDETRFQKSTQLPQPFVEAMRQFYPEAFQNGRVNATALVKGLQERPMLEVKVLGGKPGEGGSADRQILQHWLDSQPQFYTDEEQGEVKWGNDGRPVTEQDLKNAGAPQSVIDAWNSRMDFLFSEERPQGASSYGFLGPKPESDMPGYVEGLVRVPRDMVKVEEGQRAEVMPGGYTLEGRRNAIQEGRNQTMFSGPHFGSEDTNVLAFYRGYEEPRPDGTKAFHIIEVQSDWAQQARKENQLGMPAAQDHPLLPFYETLALKAAIQHAQKVGADSVILSDGETAMMTEGHDKQSNNDSMTYATEQMAKDKVADLKAKGAVNIEIEKEGDKWAVYWETGIPQNQGMRLHYDKTLPETLSKLTGEPGVPVSLGTHKGAMSEISEGMLNGSPVFRTPEGRPKTEITGREFSLDKIAGGLSDNDTLSIKEAVQKYELARQNEASARQNGNTPITDSKQIVSLLGDDTSTAKAPIDARLSSGATAAQAVVHEIMRKLGMDVHEATLEQEVQKDEVAKVLNLGQHGQETTKYGKALADENGKRLTFPSESEAMKYLTEHQRTHPEDKNDYEIRNAGGGLTSENFRGWYLAPKEGIGVSADAARGSGTVSLHDILQDYSHEESKQNGLLDSMAEDLTERPEASLEVYLRNLDVASRSPQVFAREADLELPDAIRAIRQARVVLSGNADKTLAEINAELEKANITKFRDARDYAQTMAAVRDGLDGFNRRFADSSLGSTVPHDPKLVDTIGVSRGPKAVVQWIANQKFGLMSDFAQAFLKHGQILDNLSLVLPGTETWDPKSTFYQPSLTGGEMNLSFLPQRENLHDWVSVFMHETTHHFEDQLSGRNDPAAQQYKEIRSQILDTLRESPMLPKKIRDYLDVIEKRRDYERYAAGGFKYSDLWKKDLGEADYNKYHGILYGLQNETEMVAQLFSDKDMQALAFRTKVPKTLGLWDSVVHWFSEAFGKLAGVPNNALTEILKGFDNYLTGGVLRKTYNGGDFIRDSLVSKYGTRPEALASRMQSVDQMFSRGNLQASVSGFQREMENGLLHPDQPTGQIVQNLRTALVSGEARDVFHGTMNLLAGEVPVHQELWYRMKQDFDLTRELYGMVKKGEMPGTIPEETEARMRQSGQKLNAMKQALDKQALALDRWNSLDQFDREGYEESVIAAMSGKKFAPPLGQTGDEEQAKALMGLADEPALARVKRESSLAELQQGKAAGVGDWLRRTLMLTQFLKRQFPQLRLGFDHVADQQGNAFSRMAALNTAYVFDGKSGEQSEKILESNRRVATTPTLWKAASEIKLWVQEQEKAGNDWKMDDPFIKNILSKLSPQDRDAVVQEQNSANMRHHVWTEQTVPQFFAEHNREQTAKVIVAREPGMLPQQGRQLAQQMYDSLGMLQNPETSVQGMEGLRMLSTQMQPQTYLSALGLSHGLVQDAQAHIDFMRTRSNYVTEQRLGQYHMRMTLADGKPFYTDADSKAELDARRQAMEKQGAKFNYFVPKAEANSGAGIDSDLLAQLRELDTQAYNRVAEALKDRPDVAAVVLPETQRANDYSQSLASLAPVPGAGQPTRKFVAGREFINMVDNDHQFYVRANNWMRHKLTRAYAEVDGLDPAVQGNRTMAQLLQQHVQNNLSPDNPIARKLNEATYFTKLAWNFGVNFLHGIQSLTTGMAAVISETGSVADAFETTLAAQKALIQRVATKKWANPEHEWLMNRATSEGAKGLATWSDIFDPERAVTYDSNNPTTVLGKALNTAKWAARNWTGMFMSMNDQIGLLAGYDLGRSRGMSQEEAYGFAKDMKDRGYYTGGKAQRAVGLWSIQSKAVPQLLSSLQTYTFGWFSQLTDNYINGFGKPPEGLTPTQRLGAKKAFLYQLGAQAVLAGALGLPGVGQGMALMKQATGTDVKGWVQQNLAKMFDEDQTNGGLISSLALHGAVASFSPIDPSMRHMPSFPFTGVSPYKGFDISTLAPAPVSTASDVVQGLLAAAKGDVNTLAQKALPHVLQGPYRLWQGEGDIRDKRGTLLYQLSPMEKFVEALGMEPSRVSQARDTAEAVKNIQEKQEAMLGSLADDLATTQRHEGVDAARARLRQIVQENPGVDPVKLATAAVSRIEAQSIPFSAQRMVNPALDLTGLTNQSAPQELQRTQLRQQARQGFGLPNRNPFEAQQSAAATDEVLRNNPYLPVSTARQVSSGKQRVPRGYSGTDILVGQ